MIFFCFFFFFFFFKEKGGVVRVKMKCGHRAERFH